jgi:hypothetical protein
MVHFQTKNQNLVTFWGTLELKMLEYFTAIWYILCPLGNVVVIWNIFPRFGILCHEKSGNPDAQCKVGRAAFLFFPFVLSRRPIPTLRQKPVVSDKDFFDGDCSTQDFLSKTI